MLKFVLKRFGISALILFVGSLLMYVLVINSGDPLWDLRESNDPNRENLIAQRIEQMHLNDPWYVRYGGWLKGVGGCLIGQCNLGVNRQGTSVAALLADAAGSTIRLVFIATILGIVIGVFFGVMAAIRQYSGFDYTITALAFVFYSLPAFVFAVLLKEYGAIRFNNWLADPAISIVITLILALLFALFCEAIVAGSVKKRVIVAAVTFVLAVGIMQLLSLTRWFAKPISGTWIVLIVGIAATVLFTSLLVGIGNKRALACVGGTALLFFIVLVALNRVLLTPSWPLLLGILAFGLVAAILIGTFLGGHAKASVRVAALWTVFSMFLAMLVDYCARFWTNYVALVGSRPISTVGSETPNFKGSGWFWLDFIDVATHLILPTISLTLMSVASYTRYTRSSMLEVLGQDYVRTARAKGLPEHTVMVRHAFRNAMLPITTIVAFDFAALIGGAVITETVFGWKGMGQLFQNGLKMVDPNPVMAFFLVTGAIAVFMNMVADIAYAYIDPRIRR